MNSPKAATLNGIRAAIIDLDGTMVDTALDFHAAINRMRTDLSLAAIEVDVVRHFVGKGFAHLVRGTLGVGLTSAEAERFSGEAGELFRQHYAAVNGKWSKLYPGVVEGLQAMRNKGLQLACVTNKQAAFTYPLLEKMGLHTLFDVIYAGDSLPKMKPDPLPMFTVFEHFKLHPHEVVAIGDSSNDSQAARAAGCWSLSVPYGYNHGQPVQELDSDGIVETLLEAAHRIS